MSTERITELLESYMGNKGSTEITGTGAVTGNFTAIHIIADAVVAAQTDASGTTNADLTAYTVIKQGTTLYGRWTSITLTSGEAIGYTE